MFLGILLCEATLSIMKGIGSCAILTIDILFIGCREGYDLTLKHSFPASQNRLGSILCLELVSVYFAQNSLITLRKSWLLDRWDGKRQVLAEVGGANSDKLTEIGA